jgi:hypothetical protein
VSQLNVATSASYSSLLTVTLLHSFIFQAQGAQIPVLCPESIVGVDNFPFDV